MIWPQLDALNAIAAQDVEAALEVLGALVPECRKKAAFERSPSRAVLSAIFFFVVDLGMVLRSPMAAFIY